MGRPGRRGDETLELAREWWRLAAFLLALLLGLAYLRWDAHRSEEAGQRARLEAQVRAMGDNLAHQFEGVRAALLSIRNETRDGWMPPGDAGATRALQALSEAMPGVRTLIVLDRDGRVQLSNRVELVGRDFAGREYFQRARVLDDPATLLLSPPFRSSLGVYSLNLSLALHDAQGGFAGVVAATLDPDYFRTVLGSAIYAPDMWAAVAHDEGGLLMYEPPRSGVEGTSLARPGSMFSRHLASGQRSSVFSGRIALTGEDRLIAQRTLRPEGLALDHGLVLALTRERSAMFAAWRQTTAGYAVFFVLLAGGSAFALQALHARRRVVAEVRRAAEARAQADAERLALVLDGASLGLWDVDLRSGRCVVNARWCEMLGLPADPSLVASNDAWRERVHPEDWPRVQAQQTAHLEGRSAAYEAVYRMRHADGRWVWILDRGKVMERDADGRALRMVGTHMDLSERVQAEQALQRSEQDLAITLHSIGDAVIATDAAGVVTRVNVAAERLTGWPAAEAIGQPLAQVFRIFNARTREPAVDPVQQVLARGQVVGLANDTLLVARDGREAQIADSAAPIRTPEGEVVGVVMVFSDVTEAYRVQQALRDRERQLSAISDALPAPVSRVDRDGRYLFANSAYERWFGLRQDQVVGRTQAEVLGPHYARVEPHVRRALAGETVRYETPVDAVPGRLHALVTLVPDVGADGRVQGHFTIVADITERKRAEDALRASEQRTRTLLDTLAAGVVVHAADTRIVDSNPAASAILGLTREQLEGRAAIDPAWHFVEPDGTPMALERYPISQVLASGTGLHQFIGGVRHPERPGTTWVLVNAEPVLDARGRIEQVVISFVDISPQLQAQSELRLLEAAVARLNDIVLITDAPDDPAAPTRIVYVNDAFERVTGYARAQAIGRSPQFLQGPLTDRAELARVGAAVRRRQPVHTELLNVARDGRHYWIEIDIVPLADRTGRVTHMVAIERDVTERRQAQARLQAAQADLAATVAAIPDLLFELTLDGRVENFHSPRSDLLVRPVHEQIGRQVDELLPEAAAAEVRLALLEAHRSGFSGGRRYALSLPQGVHWFELSAASKRVADGEPPRVVLLARDITDRQRAEADRRALEVQLREAQKMEAIGTLAGGIAHDFNNVIAGILGNAALAKADLEPTHAAAACVDQIERAGLRARALVRRILAFSRREAVPFVPLALRGVLEEPLALLRATVPPDVRLVASLASEPVCVLGDATQLQQVLMNLCVNAWQALPPGGGRVEVGLEADARTAHVWVRDDGVGMDEATQARIFDPFFTTKGAGRGTGLGLAVVRGIVTAHHGRIRVDSRPGAGTTFHIELPRVEAGTGPAAEPAGAPSSPQQRGRGQQLLYVDDDEIMRQVVQRLLEREGWQVSTAVDAADALRQLSRAGHEVELVVTDMNMPDQNGLTLCRQLRLHHPELPVMLVSGQLSDELVAQAAAAGARRVLAKEDLLDELAPAIASLLETPADDLL